MPLFREDLEDPPARCSVPGCTDAHEDRAMWFHAPCHMTSPTWVRYEDEILTIQCARCKRDIVSIVIASREPHVRN